MPDIYLYPALANPTDIGLLDPTILIVDGAATVTVTASLSAAGLVVMDGAATLAATGSVAAAGGVVVDGTANLPATGTLSAAGLSIVDGTALLSATAALAATGDAEMPVYQNPLIGRPLKRRPLKHWGTIEGPAAATPIIIARPTPRIVDGSADLVSPMFTITATGEMVDVVLEDDEDAVEALLSYIFED